MSYLALAAATVHTLGFHLTESAKARIGDLVDPGERERGSYTTEQVVVTVGLVVVALGAVAFLGRYVQTKLAGLR